MGKIHTVSTLTQAADAKAGRRVTLEYAVAGIAALRQRWLRCPREKSPGGLKKELALV